MLVRLSEEEGCGTNTSCPVLTTLVSEQDFLLEPSFPAST